MVSRGINKVILVGNLGQNPEVRYMPSGSAVTNITLATSESWRDKNTGEIKEQTEWHRIVIFGKLAEIAGEYLRKGSQIYIEGQLRTRKWSDQSGQDKYITEVIVNTSGTMQMLGNRQHGNNTSLTSNNSSVKNWNQQQQLSHNDRQTGSYNTTSCQQQESVVSSSNESAIDFDDDIPF